MNREELKNEVNMKVAEIYSELSTCQYTKVGAVLVNPINNRLISIGYNGSLPGEPHCYDKPISREDHKKWSDENEVHAEISAILNAAKNGQSTEGAYMYSTLAPCMNCAKHITASGIRKVFFREFYWRQGNELFCDHILNYQQLVKKEEK